MVAGWPRRATVKQLATAEHGGLQLATADHGGLQLATADHGGPRRATAELQNFFWPRHAHGMNTAAHRSATSGLSVSDEVLSFFFVVEGRKSVRGT